MVNSSKVPGMFSRTQSCRSPAKPLAFFAVLALPEIETKPEIEIRCIPEGHEDNEGDIKTRLEKDSKVSMSSPSKSLGFLTGLVLEGVQM
jgi:hypothetical protein